MIQSSGKVREIYEADEDHLVLVTTDRISAFDVIMPTEIKNKGVILNQLAASWFSKTADIVPNHMMTIEEEQMPDFFRQPAYQGRCMLVKKLAMLPYEFVVRGYMFGSLWETYQSHEIILNRPYQLAEKLDQPLFCIAQKNKTGHDVYISDEEAESKLGSLMLQKIKEYSLKLYERVYDEAKNKEILLADTKFEFGLDTFGELILADEIFTPDSSRYWDAKTYQCGQNPKSFDKQYLRDWLLENGYAGKAPAPELPDEIVLKTKEKYEQCLRLLD